MTRAHSRVGTCSTLHANKPSSVKPLADRGMGGSGGHPPPLTKSGFNLNPYLLAPLLYENVDKKLSASWRLCPADPHQWLCPWTPLGAPTPDPRYRLELRTCHGPPLPSPPPENRGSAHASNCNIFVTSLILYLISASHTDNTDDDDDDDLL